MKFLCDSGNNTYHVHCYNPETITSAYKASLKPGGAKFREPYTNIQFTQDTIEKIKRKAGVRDSESILDLLFPSGISTSTIAAPSSLTRPIRISPQTSRYSQQELNQKLFNAVKNNDISGVRRYVLEGANPNIRDRGGNTPLMVAANEGNVFTTEILLVAGARVNILNDNKMSALHYAAMNGNIDLVKLLVKNKASKTQRSKAGFSPVDLSATETINKYFHS
jgi:ankyrin repeat protein